MDHDTRRKAAILIRSLDPESSAALIAQLSADEAKALRAAIRELGDIDETEQQKLIGELRRDSNAKPASHAGVELSLSPTSTLPHTPASPLATTPRPFAWLEEGDLPTLAARLAREQVSTVALVLSLLPGPRAGAVLAALPHDLQSASLARLAELGDVDPASLDLVESDLENWLRSHKASERRRLDRQSSIANILQHTSPQARQRVTVTLEKQGAAWLAPLRQRLRDEAVAPQRGPAPQTRQATIAAGHQVDALRTSPAAQPPQQAIRPPRDISPAVVEPQRPLPPFDSLATLDASGFAAIARECGADTVVSALAGAAPAMHTLVRRWLPASHYRELMRRIHSLSDVSLRDIDAAQHRMMQVATRLADRSMIAWRPTSHR